jgi:hypothetical protein
MRTNRPIAMLPLHFQFLRQKLDSVDELFAGLMASRPNRYADTIDFRIFGKRQWTEALPVVPLLQKLFKPGDFERHVCVTDEPATILKFLGERSREETPAQRRVRGRRA